ncbi:hypothetical protein [Streptomyces sp. NPDC058867]|uniref:hypothetical protein n=1 Tax=unclassified Streptomyces TaxID=2593676 RepID=UPI003679B631
MCGEQGVGPGLSKLGLPQSPDVLARLAEEKDCPALAAGLVRTALDKRIAQDITARTDS